MPLKSQSQRRFMFATMPEVAEKWAKHTKNIKSLPEKVKKKKVIKRKISRRKRK